MKIKVLNYKLGFVKRTKRDPLYKEKIISALVLYIIYICITIPLQPNIWLGLSIYVLIVLYNTMRNTSIKDYYKKIRGIK